MRKTVSDVFQPQTQRGEKALWCSENGAEIRELRVAPSLSHPPGLSKGLLQSLGWKMRRGHGKDGAERESQPQHHTGKSGGMGESPCWGLKSPEKLHIRSVDL